MIRSIDVDGNVTKVRSRGQFNITGYDTVLQVLTNRAQKYHQRVHVTGPRALLVSRRDRNDQDFAAAYVSSSLGKKSDASSDMS